MNEFIEKLIGRLEEYKTKAYVTGITNNPYEFGACNAMDSAIKIVNELAEEYKGAEEQGLLLRLPCKIGDELWWYDAYGDLRTSKVNSMFVEFGIDGIVIETLICNIYANDIGKTVFLTKEEAEQTLKQIGE